MKLKLFAIAISLALILSACDKQEEKFAGFTPIGENKKVAKFYLDTNTVKRDRSGWVRFNMVRDLTDSYVIQNAKTNCENHFITEEGVKYRQDGTSQEKFASETMSLPIDKRDITALVKMACDTAEENRNIKGAFDDGKALEILFGNYDANNKTASWEKIDPPTSLEGYEKFAGETGIVKVLESKDFEQDGKTKHILLISTSVSYVDGALLSSVVFVKNDDKWEIEKERSYLIIFDKNVVAVSANTNQEFADLAVTFDAVGTKTQEFYRFINGKYVFLGASDLNLLRFKFQKELAKDNHIKIWFEQSFKTGNETFHVIFTKRSENGLFDDCHACGVKVGIATYKKENNFWQTLSIQPDFGEFGSYGDMPEIKSAKLLNLSLNKIIFLIDRNDIHFGVEEEWSNLFLFSKNEWYNVGSIETGSDTSGFYDESNSNKISAYKGIISVIESNKEYPDLLLTKKGTEEINDKIILAKNSLYVFNGKEYEEKVNAKVSTAKNEKVAVVQDSSAVNSSIVHMIEYAVDNGGVDHESEIQEEKFKIESSSKPKKGNKKAARKINDEAHALLNKQDIDGAVAKFSEANRLDPSDVEIINNLGFAYLKQKNLDAAQKALMSTLTIAPSRAAAWGNLGDVFALKGDEIKAVACYSNTYRFSKDITKTHQFMKTMNATEDVSALKQARDVAMTLALKMYPNLQ
jgi:tetratricopeptide (TPR) repeat protein